MWDNARAAMKLRSHLVTLVLAVLVPMIVFAVIVVGLFGREQRDGVEQGAVETARALMNAVDETLNTSVKTLEVLAWSRTLDRESSLAEFHGDARRILQSRPEWAAISLFAPDGRQLIHTSRAPGESLPGAAEPASLAAVAGPMTKPSSPCTTVSLSPPTALTIGIHP